jgi:hypothetical protein
LERRRLPPLAWRSCTPKPDAPEWACPPAAGAPPGAPGVFLYRPDAPEQSRFYASDGRTDGQLTPAVVVLAEAAGLHEIRPTTTTTDSQLAVLVDLLEHRVLVGTPELVGSTLVDLLYLNGRYAKHFEKFDERVGYDGERVVSWRIHAEP